MPKHFWIAVEWVLAQRKTTEWKSEYLRRLGKAVR